MAAPETTTSKKAKHSQQHRTFPSPLELYKHKFCRVCNDSQWCKPNEQRMLICVLCAILDTTLRTNQLQQQRGAHY